MKIREDILTPKQRSEAFGNKKPIDRIICAPMVASNASHLIGRTIKEFQLDPEVMAASHIAAYKKFKYDSIGLCTNCSVTAEAMGAVLVYPEDDVASCDEPIIKSREDLCKIKVADEHDGNLWVFYKAAEIINKEVGDEVSVSISLSGPLTTVAMLRGVEAFARDMYSDPEFCHILLRMATDSVKNHIRAIVAHGAEIGGVGDPIASGSLISPKMFQKFAFPYIKELIDFIHGLNRSAGLHICGKTSKILEQMVQTGANLISIDDVDLALVRDVVAGRAVILGNISPTNEMLYGPVEKIHEVCKNAIDIMKGYEGGYILSTGCDTTPVAPFENVQAMMDAARSYGLYEYSK